MLEEANSYRGHDLFVSLFHCYYPDNQLPYEIYEMGVVMYSQRWRSGDQGRDLSIRTYLDFDEHTIVNTRSWTQCPCACRPLWVSQEGEIHVAVTTHLTACRPCSRTSTAGSLEYECIRRRICFSRTSCSPCNVRSVTLASRRHLNRASQMWRRTSRCAFPVRLTTKERGAIGGWGALERANWCS